MHPKKYCSQGTRKHAGVVVKGKDVLPTRHCVRLPGAGLAIGEDSDVVAAQGGVEQRGYAARPQHICLATFGAHAAMELKAARHHCTPQGRLHHLSYFVDLSLFMFRHMT